MSSVSHRHPDLPMTLCTVTGSAKALLASLVVSLVAKNSLTPSESMEKFVLFTILDSLCIAVVFVTLNTAPRYIPGTEVSLITLMETVLGPLWVFLVLGEVPSPFTLGGGGILLVAVSAHQIINWRQMIKLERASSQSERERKQIEFTASQAEI